MIRGKTPRQPIILNINQIKVEESLKLVLLGLTINNRLIFKFLKFYLKIKQLQYKALKFIYDSSESYDELLSRSNEVSIYQKHLRTHFGYRNL